MITEILQHTRETLHALESLAVGQDLRAMSVLSGYGAHFVSIHTTTSPCRAVVVTLRRQDGGSTGPWDSVEVRQGESCPRVFPFNPRYWSFLLAALHTLIENDFPRIDTTDYGYHDTIGGLRCIVLAFWTAYDTGTREHVTLARVPSGLWLVAMADADHRMPETWGLGMSARDAYKRADAWRREEQKRAAR